LAFAGLAARPQGKQVGSQMMDFYEIWNLRIFENPSRKFKFL